MMARRPEGHVRKRGSSWAVVISVTDPTTGERKRRWVTVPGTKGLSDREARKLAERKLRELLEARDDGTLTEGGDQSTAAFLERWLDSTRATVAPKTHQRYDQLIRHHVTATKLGRKRLRDVKPLDVQQLLNNLRRVDGKGPLHPRTCNHVRTCLATAFQAAVGWELIVRNPVSATKPQKVAKSEPKAITIEQSAALLDAVEGTVLYPPVLLGIATGARLGECLAVRWSDVDFDARTVTIDESVQILGGDVRFKSTKTERVRTVELPDWAVAALRRHKASQAQARLVAGSGYDVDADLVCAGADGTVTRPDTVGHGLRDLTDRLGFKVTHHMLRHTHATLLLDAGEPLAAVSDRLGHAGPHITLAVYTHRAKDADRRAADKFDQLWKDAR